jgi:hypothetical protein
MIVETAQATSWPISLQREAAPTDVCPDDVCPDDVCPDEQVFQATSPSIGAMPFPINTSLVGTPSHESVKVA